MGRNVYALRVRAGLTQEAFGERLGSDDRYVRRLEAGAFNLELDTVEFIAERLGVDPALLVRRARPAAKRLPGRPRRPLT
ncbi:MAG: helix-turn-helix transcriptional regulator [Myxococcaceae bacterium]|nr:helix-turn-helix transcriptional regulator [Myxococcaceae bacterium]